MAQAGYSSFCSVDGTATVPHVASFVPIWQPGFTWRSARPSPRRKVLCFFSGIRLDAISGTAVAISGSSAACDRSGPRTLRNQTQRSRPNLKTSRRSSGSRVSQLSVRVYCWFSSPGTSMLWSSTVDIQASVRCPRLALDPSLRARTHALEVVPAEQSPSLQVLGPVSMAGLGREPPAPKSRRRQSLTLAAWSVSDLDWPAPGRLAICAGLSWELWAGEPRSQSAGRLFT